MTWLILIVLALYTISECCGEQNLWFGSLASSLDVRCHYTERYSNGRKHFCKVGEDGLCNLLVSSQENITEPDYTEQHGTTPNRFTLTDNRQDRFFTVHLKNLRAEDTGVYLCGSENPSPPFTKVLLVGGEARIIVNPVIGYIGGETKLRCPYDTGYQTSLKYLSRGECSSTGGEVPIGTHIRRHTQATQGRFSLEDERKARVFTVTISNLAAEDSGKYCCGIETLDNSALLELLLNVTASTTPSATSDEDKEPFAPTPSLHTLPSVTTQPASCTTGTGLVLSVSRVVTMLLFAVGATLFFSWRKKHTQEISGDVSQDQPDPIYQELDLDTNQ